MLKTVILDLSEKNILIRLLKNTLKKALNEYRNMIYLSTRLDKDTVVFEAFSGKEYSDSPKAIYEYLLSSPQYTKLQFIWVLNDVAKYRGPKTRRTRFVKRGSIAYYRAFAKSRYWVVNDWLPLGIRKKSRQVALQTWHGTPLKRLRNDISSPITTEHRRVDISTNDSDVSRYNYFISSSTFTSRVFSSAFNLAKLDKENILIETGSPRTDRLFNYRSSDIVAIKRSLNISKHKKVLFYAPTWRDDQYPESGYSTNTAVDIEALYDKLGDEWVLLFRSHSIIADNYNFKEFENFIFDVSHYSDINDLYAISDVLVTDYSSVFFDFAILERPIVFYMYDLEHYRDNLRGFYIDITNLPGVIVKTQKELVETICSNRLYIDDAKYKKFNSTYNYLHDGNATSRVVRKMFSD